MKINKLTYLCLALLTLLCIACGDETNTEERNFIALDSLQFSNDSKTALLNANIVGNPVMGDPSDTLNTKYRVFEISDIGDTLSSTIAPNLIKVRNVAKEQMEKIDLKVVVIVDLTMDQPLVNEAKMAVQNMRRLFNDGNIYVSFITDKSNISVSVPLSDDLLENDFVSTYDESYEKYLYRNLLIMMRECCLRDNIPGHNKALVLLSDGVVWGLDSPLDPDHFVIQQELLDFAEEQETKVPVFFAGMSNEEELSPETNTTMQLVCSRTGGACTQGFDLNEMHKALCRVHNLDVIDLQYELEFPDKRVFWGEPTSLVIQCLQGDSLVAFGERSYRKGSLFDPITINGQSQSAYVLFGLIQCLLFILLCYIVLQILLPYVRYRIFRRKYIAPYTGTGMTIAGRIMADTCYFCKAPFQPGEMIVGRCQHTMHEECWEENDCHCTEYGVGCQEGSHFYDKSNLFNPANAPYYMRWILAALIASVLAWSIFFIIPGHVKSEVFLALTKCILDDNTAHQTLNYVYRQPSYGFWGSFLFVSFIYFLVRFRLPVLYQIRDILLRGMIAGVGAYLILSIDVLICTSLNIDKASDLIGLFTLAPLTIWITFVVSYHTDIRPNWRLVAAAYVVYVLGMFLGTNYYWDGTLDFRILQLISQVAYNVILAIAYSFDIKRSQHYFLHVEGAIKTMDIALYKWMRTSPDTVVTIGKSVNCNLQMSWEIERDVAPLQAEIKLYAGHPRLYAKEYGVWLHDDSQLEVDDYLKLYHGTKFRIGDTTFTYIEKDK